MDGRVVFLDGEQGEIWPELLGADGSAPSTRVRLGDGRQILVPTDLLRAQADGDYAVALRVSELPAAGPARPALASDDMVIPIIEESLVVSKEVVERSRTRVTKTVGEREEVVDEPLSRTTVEVTRVPVGRFVDAVPDARREGDTLIIPVVEEVLVVEKRLRLVEEVHVVERQTEYRAPQTIVVRREEVTVERLPPASETAPLD